MEFVFDDDNKTNNNYSNNNNTNNNNYNNDIYDNTNDTNNNRNTFNRKSINFKRNPMKQGLSSSSSNSFIPEKFICSKSRTTYLKPTYLTEKHLEASGNSPSCNLTKSFVFGFKLVDLYSGPKFYCLKPVKENQHRIIVYTTASLGIIHNLTTNTQNYFEGHTDDITCFNVDSSSNYVVSGQLGN